MGVLHLLLGILMTVLVSSFHHRPEHVLFLTERTWVHGGPCPYGTPLTAAETDTEIDPFGAIEKKNASKYSELQRAAACLNKYAVSAVNKFRAEAVGNMSAPQRETWNKTGNAIINLKIGPSFLHQEALNRTFLMSKQGKTFPDLVVKNEDKHCASVISWALDSLTQVNATDTAATNPAQMCVDALLSNAKPVLLGARHEEVVAGIYLDRRGFVWCTMIFSRGTNFTMAPDCVEASWVSAIPTPEAESTISDTPEPTEFVIPAPITSIPSTPASSATPTVSSSASSTEKPTPSSVIDATFSPLPSLNKSIVVPADLKEHPFKNQQIMYKMMNGTEAILDLKCPEDCMYCMLKSNVNWCFSAYFTVYIDLYISSKA